MLESGAAMSIPILPALPIQPPLRSKVVLNKDEWRWIGQAFQTIHDDNEAIIGKFGPLNTLLEKLMATVAELQAVIDANTVATDAAGIAITAEIAQLAAAVAALSTTAPPTQAQLDQLTASTTKLTEATAALLADDPAAPVA